MISKIYMRNYSYIYESAQIENFERQILSGYLTEAKLIEMYENNELSEHQIKVVQELFGGLGNIGRAIGSGLKSAGQAIGQKAGQVGNAAVAGAKQVGQNVSDMYKTGEQERLANQQVQSLAKLLTQIQQVIATVKTVNPSLAKFIGSDPKLSNLVYQVNQIAQSSTNKASGARQQGFTGGVGGAMSQGYNQ